MRLRSVTIAVVLFSWLIQPVLATWSIVIIDRKTKEVAVGSATCLNNFDLRAITPVIRVGVGGAAVQAAGDFDGRRRPVIRREFLNSSDASEMLSLLAGITGHQSRQYGIAETRGTVITFTGSSNGAHASGISGEIGDLVYAIQGNVITGRPVILEAEKALRDTPGDMADKLMASMQAARAMGGDGRCSCSPGNPPGCGSPPPSFNKSAHIGYMILARLGDIDSDVCDAGGCARGDYFMNFNVPFQPSQAPDPVIQLQGMFDQWRSDHEGRPDALRSVVEVDNQVGMIELNVELKDWKSAPVGHSVQTFEARHAPGSAKSFDIGAIEDNGDGTYCVPLTPNGLPGFDRIELVADDGQRPVTLLPLPRVGESCGLSVKTLAAKPKTDVMAVKVKLSGSQGGPLDGNEIFAKITSDTADPTEVSLGATNAKGKAKNKVQVAPGRHRVVIAAILPSGGGQCFDPDLPGQEWRSEFVQVP